MKTAGVIGSGFAGLSAATFLAKQGVKTTVFEKNSMAGGRAQWFESNGFMFDMGPSWYWMPDVFEKYFAAFNKKPSDYYELIRLDPSYQVIFSENESYHVPASIDGIYELFESLEKGAAGQLKKFLKEAKYKYETGMNDLVYKPGNSFTEFIDWKVISGFFRMQLLTSISSHIKKHFKDPRIIQLLEFPVLFLGAKPSQTPALYSLMNYADISLGTWYPKGGMRKVAEGMYHLAKEMDVEFHFNAPVEKIIPEKNHIKLNVVNRAASFHSVIAAADYHYVEQNLLEKNYRNYTEDYWEKKVMAPSSLLFYIGLNKKVNKLLHHNLFFDEAFEPHAHTIYDEASWPEKPLFYVCCPSKSDPEVAPEGQENLFILIPLAPGLKDDDSEREKLFQTVWKRLEKFTGMSLREHIVYKRSYAHNDFETDYHAYKGNAYGLANTLTQTAFLKPTIKSSKIKNLFYAGQLTVPGPGVPPSLISGQLAATEALKTFNQQQLIS